MRHQNLALVLGTVDAHGPLSRADVAARTGLTRAAISSLVDELIGGGVLVEAASTTASGRVGRPGRDLSVTDQGPAGLGLEVGVTHLSACVADLRGEVRVHRRVAAANAGRPVGDVLAEAAALAAEVEAQAAAVGLRVEGRVLAVPGAVGLGPGAVVESAPNLGWHRVDLAEHWPRAQTLPEAENEANLGALAELWQQGAADTFVHLSAEAGIGAALVVDGSLFRGARGYAGELGHVPVHPDGPRCRCGARGCLEQYAGEPAVLRAAGLAADTPDPVVVLADRARAGDAPALRALDQAGTALGIALAGAVNLVDPAALLLGGAYAELADWLLPPMRAELAARVTVRPWAPDWLAASRLGRRGPVVGAALLTVRRILDDPARLWA
ncbi:ROK family protein [Kitasatospora sp. NPDC058965]|uniref:ROK family protein n=1 Tax=Kitasatospora sp. NPDC058965 TaxID=3346682 RepID=UPI0036876095